MSAIETFESADLSGGIIGSASTDATAVQSSWPAFGSTVEFTDATTLEPNAADVPPANDRLESFAAELCHDLLQPVAALDGFLSLLQDDLAMLSGDRQDWLAGAIRAKNRVVETIDALYRNATQRHVALVPVDLHALVLRLVPPLVDEIDSAHLVMGELPVVAADPGFVAQVLANLVQNAGRYRHAQRPLRIEMRARRDQSFWIVTVSDSGRGIRTSELEWIFERGARGHSSEGTIGTGTGLATVKTLMRRMGGDIWAEPDATGGARMCLRFRAVRNANLAE